MTRHWKNKILTIIAGVILTVSGCGDTVSAPSETVKEQENSSASESATPEDSAGEEVTDEIKDDEVEEITLTNMTLDDEWSPEDDENVRYLEHIDDYIDVNGEIKTLFDEAEKNGTVTDWQDTVIRSIYAGDARIYQIYSSDSYNVFFSTVTRRLIVKNKDEDFVYIDEPVISNHEEKPIFYEYDLDGDGEGELLIMPHILHGTGYFEDLLFIVDGWSAYKFDYTQYMDAFINRISYKMAENTVTPYLDGMAVGEPYDISEVLKTNDKSEIAVYMEKSVCIVPYDGRIMVSTQPYFDYRTMNEAHEKYWYIVKYLGDGKVKEEDLVCRQSEVMYRKIITDALRDNQMYYIWDNPFFPEPLVLISDKGYYDMDWQSEHLSPKSDVFALEDNKLVLFGTVECMRASYHLSLGARGLLTADNHSKTVYVPDFENRKIVISEAVEDNVLNALGVHDGFVRLLDGQLQNISEEEYITLSRKYSYESNPIIFEDK